MSARSTNLSIKKPFTVYTKSKSFIGSAPPRLQCNNLYIHYSMSNDEHQIFEMSSNNSMRQVKNKNCTIDRKLYLQSRLDCSPRAKYYYPEATSWRYGWIRSNPSEA